MRARITCCIAVLLGLHALEALATVTAATDRRSAFNPGAVSANWRRGTPPRRPGFGSGCHCR